MNISIKFIFLFYRSSGIPGECIGLKFIPSQSELFRFIPIFVSEPIRIIPNQSEKRFISRLMKNGQKSIRLNPINSETFDPKEFEPIRNQVFKPDQSESIQSRIDPNRIFNQNQSKWIQGRNYSDWFWLKIRFGLIRDRIDSDWSGSKTWFWIGSDSFGLMSRN